MDNSLSDSQEEETSKIFSEDNLEPDLPVTSTCVRSRPRKPADRPVGIVLVGVRVRSNVRDQQKRLKFVL